jgi:hypothetical protein
MRPRAGAFTTWWWFSASGALAIPCGPVQTLAPSAWVKTSGVGASGHAQLILYEFDVNGTFLRGGTAATLTGNQAAWTQLAGTYTTGADCARVGFACVLTDATTGSPNAIGWFDNAQLWNQTQLPNQVR